MGGIPLNFAHFNNYMVTMPGVFFFKDVIFKYFCQTFFVCKEFSILLELVISLKGTLKT